MVHFDAGGFAVLSVVLFVLFGALIFALVPQLSACFCAFLGLFCVVGRGVSGFIQGLIGQAERRLSPSAVPAPPPPPIVPVLYAPPQPRPHPQPSSNGGLPDAGWADSTMASLEAVERGEGGLRT